MSLNCLLRPVFLNTLGKMLYKILLKRPQNTVKKLYLNKLDTETNIVFFMYQTKNRDPAKGIIEKMFFWFFLHQIHVARLRRTASSMSDCRSRDRMFKPQFGHITSVEIDCEIISTVILPLLLIQGQLLVTSASMCTKCWLIA